MYPYARNQEIILRTQTTGNLKRFKKFEVCSLKYYISIWNQRTVDPAYLIFLSNVSVMTQIFCAGFFHNRFLVV